MELYYTEHILSTKWEKYEDTFLVERLIKLSKYHKDYLSAQAHFFMSFTETYLARAYINYDSIVCQDIIPNCTSLYGQYRKSYSIFTSSIFT